MDKENLREQMLTSVMRELSRLGEEERRIIGLGLLTSTLAISQESFSIIFENNDTFLFAINEDAKLGINAIKSERKTVTGAYKDGEKRRFN